MLGLPRLSTGNCELLPPYPLDPAATENEKANAERLKGRLEDQLPQEATPEWAWTGIMFRLGRGVKEITSPPSPKGDWTDHALKLGRMFRKGLKR
jgi:hypothetical protein